MEASRKKAEAGNRKCLKWRPFSKRSCGTRLPRGFQDNRESEENPVILEKQKIKRSNV